MRPRGYGRRSSRRLSRSRRPRWDKSRSPPSASSLLKVAAKFVPHGGKQLVAESSLAAGAEPLIERGRKHRRRYRLVNRGLDRPATFAGIRNLAGKIAQLR